MSVYCTAPWNGLTIRENGEVKTCCVGRTTLGNLNTDSIQAIESGNILSSLRESMLQTKPDLDNCRDCIEHESRSGLSSLRQHYLTHYPNIDNLQLQFLDIRWNNTCNLGCMYCSPLFSSTWVDRLSIDKKITPVRPYQDQLLEWILERSDHVKEIMLVGGEPMLMKQNYALLKRLPQDCRISIITNLSYDLEHLPCIDSLLSRPADCVVWNVSLENTGQQFEYVRNGANWLQVENNLKYIANRWPVSINIVYSIFSAFGLVDTIKTLHQLGIKKFMFMPVGGVPEIDIFRMPEAIKLAASKELESAVRWHTESLHPEDRDLYPMVGVEPLLASLQLPTLNPITREEVKNKIKWFDSWNTGRFEDLWPNTVLHLLKN